jgi:hypothetical protein
MANNYDRILKENSDFLIPIIAKWFHVNLNRVEPLKDKMQRTLEREADFCVKVLEDNPDDEHIFHVEFQTSPDYSAYRGLFYRSFLSYNYNLPVRQVVVYVGKEPHRIQTSLEEPNLSYRLEIVDFRSRSYREFLYKDTPEEIIMAILCNLKGEDPEKIIIEILERIRNFELDRAGKCSVQLQFLSNLRDLQSLVTKNIKKMPLNIDLSKDPFFVEMWELAEKSANEYVNAKYEAEYAAKYKAELAAKQAELAAKQAELAAKQAELAAKYQIEITAKKAEINAYANSQIKSIENMLKLGRFSAKEVADLLVVPLAFVLEVQEKMNGAASNKTTKSRKK